ncbi:MAG: TetR family transcriptional regulator [Streptosporangiales bacterium]|nr:TetR family transcriptional regulator [Streptosporangiales bacterium]
MAAVNTSPARARSYDSPVRRAKAARTRAAILAAARESFETRGWQGTTMREIAAAAGVAVETVYAMVGSKAAILDRLMDVAVVGDEEPVPLRDRPEFRRLSEGTRADRARVVAELMWDINSRVGGLERAAQQGAVVEESVATLQADSLARKRVTLREGLDLMGVASPTEEQVIGILAVTSSDVYLLLTREFGIDRQGYVGWLAATIREHLARGALRRSRRTPS